MDAGTHTYRVPGPRFCITKRHRACLNPATETANNTSMSICGSLPLYRPLSARILFLQDGIGGVASSACAAERSLPRAWGPRVVPVMLRRSYGGATMELRWSYGGIKGKSRFPGRLVIAPVQSCRPGSGTPCWRGGGSVHTSAPRAKQGCGGAFCFCRLSGVALRLVPRLEP